MNRAYKFRIYPTREQEILIHKTFGCCRFVYNHMLADKKQAYEETKKTIKITPAAYKKEYPWLKEVDSLALANEQLHLERAYRKFFEESKTGFPKFKSKHGSRYYQKQKRKVARCHEKVRNQRKDYHHKLSFRLAEEYDAVAVENLDLKTMSRGLNFGKSVMDNGYGNFLNILSYKLEQRGKVLVKTDRFYPSSKKCSKCGKVKETLALSERTYHCSCGNHMDRDVNAAINIREEGKRLLCA